MRERERGGGEEEKDEKQKSKTEKVLLVRGPFNQCFQVDMSKSKRKRGDSAGELFTSEAQCTDLTSHQYSNS